MPANQYKEGAIWLDDVKFGACIHDELQCSMEIQQADDTTEEDCAPMLKNTNEWSRIRDNDYFKQELVEDEYKLHRFLDMYHITEQVSLILALHFFVSLFCFSVKMLCLWA